MSRPPREPPASWTTSRAATERRRSPPMPRVRAAPSCWRGATPRAQLPRSAPVASSGTRSMLRTRPPRRRVLLGRAHAAAGDLEAARLQLEDRGLGVLPARRREGGHTGAGGARSRRERARRAHVHVHGHRLLDRLVAAVGDAAWSDPPRLARPHAPCLLRASDGGEEVSTSATASSRASPTPSRGSRAWSRSSARSPSTAASTASRCGFASACTPLRRRAWARTTWAWASTRPPASRALAQTASRSSPARRPPTRRRALRARRAARRRAQGRAGAGRRRRGGVALGRGHRERACGRTPRPS